MKFFNLFILAIILLPTISKANSILLDIQIQSLIKIQDKLVINSVINGETVSKIINYGIPLVCLINVYKTDKEKYYHIILMALM